MGSGLVGANGSYSTITNCYRYEGQTFYLKQGSTVYTTPNNTLDISCSSEQFNRAQFYLYALGWNADIWDFTILDFEAGKYPALKVIN